MKAPPKLVVVANFFVVLFLTFHRPVPWNFTDTLYDRLIMFFMELIMRFTYIYPAPLFYDDPLDQLNYTRTVGDFLLSFVSPSSLFDPDLHIEDAVFDSVNVRVYVPRHNRSNFGAVAYFHGGAFVIGNIKMFESITRRLAKSTGMVVVSIDYRLAPEHIFPAGLNDCESVVLYMMRYAYQDYDFDPYRIVLMGDSAGGGLVASLSQRLRHRNDYPPIAAQVMVYPLVQFHNLKTSSYKHYYREMDGTAFLDPRILSQYYLMYAGLNLKDHKNLVDIILNNQHISPIDRIYFDRSLGFGLLTSGQREEPNVSLTSYDVKASQLMAPFLFNPDFVPLAQTNLSGLPEALVVTCEHDILRDEGIIYAQRLEKAGVKTTWRHLPTSFHGLLNFHTTLGTASNAFDYISEWISNHS